LIANSVPEAPIAGRLLEAFGVARDRITLESRSRTTDENARFTRELVGPESGERWLLVTSAFHMPRSIARSGPLVSTWKPIRSTGGPRMGRRGNAI